MATTAYQSLQDNVSNLAASVKAAQSNLSALQTDPAITKLLGTLTATNQNEWIDSAGVKWAGPDAQAAHSGAANTVANWKVQVKLAGDNLTNLQNQYTAAQKDLAAYEKTSPVAIAANTAAAAAAAATSTNTGKVIVAISILLIGTAFIVGIVLFFKERKKYSISNA